MAAGDPASPAAQDLGRRWKALYELFTGGDKAIQSKVDAVWRDAFADPAAAARLPVSQEMFAFIDAALKAADAHQISHVRMSALEPERLLTRPQGLTLFIGRSMV